MSEELGRLAIVEELGAQLAAGFRRRESSLLRRPALRVAALAAAAGVGAGVVLVTQLSGGPSEAQAAAARVLTTAAAQVVAHPGAMPRPDQFLFVRWRDTYLTPVRTAASAPLALGELRAPKALVTTTGWTSWSVTRVGNTGGRVLSVTFPTAAARALWVRLGRPRLGFVPAGIVKITPVEAIPVGRVSLRIRQLLRFPADPRTIAARWFGGESAANVISDIPNIEELPLRANLRAAIYRALTLVPGITFVGSARTLDGRVGNVIGTPDGVVRSDLIIDPDTGGLLGTRTVVLDAKAIDLPKGTVFAQQIIVRRAITNRPAPPAAKPSAPSPPAPKR
jgi:hypothetical protein